MHRHSTLFPVAHPNVTAIQALPTQFDLLLAEAIVGSPRYIFFNFSQKLRQRAVLVRMTLKAVSSLGFPVIPDLAKEKV